MIYNNVNRWLVTCNLFHDGHKLFVQPQHVNDGVFWPIVFKSSYFKKKLLSIHVESG